MPLTTAKREHDERYSALARMTPSRKISVLLVKGSDADGIGAIGLRMMAKNAGKPVAVEQPTQYHNGRIYWPNDKD